MSCDLPSVARLLLPRLCECILLLHAILLRMNCIWCHKVGAVAARAAVEGNWIWRGMPSSGGLLQVARGLAARRGAANAAAQRAPRSCAYMCARTSELTMMAASFALLRPWRSTLGGGAGGGSAGGRVQRCSVRRVARRARATSLAATLRGPSCHAILLVPSNAPVGVVAELHGGPLEPKASSPVAGRLDAASGREGKEPIMGDLMQLAVGAKRGRNQN